MARELHLVRRVGFANPVMVEHARERSKSFENRLADQVTTFSGSMRFVYLHAIWFALWIGLGVESFPFGLLTAIVSLEAIFLSTFVMISQNRADEKREALANQAWQTVQHEGMQNEELLDLSREILALTRELRRQAIGTNEAALHADATLVHGAPPA
jgi:uncharacterized membrane protein